MNGQSALLIISLGCSLKKSQTEDTARSSTDKNETDEGLNEAFLVDTVKSSMSNQLQCLISMKLNSAAFSCRRSLNMGDFLKGSAEYLLNVLFCTSQHLKTK